MSTENKETTVNAAENAEAMPRPGTKDALKAENDALRAENEAQKAELEALKAAQEEKAEPSGEEPKAAADERVDLFVPRGAANDEPNLLLAVNGVNYLLPRGKTSKVPPFVKALYDRTQKAQEKLDARIDKMLEASK